jgi:hypothetical protein
MAISIVVQYVSLVVTMDCWDYTALDPSDKDYNHHLVSYETTAVYLGSLISYVTSGMTLTVYDPFLEPFFKNGLLCVGLVFVVGVGVWMFVLRWDWLYGLMQFKRTRDSKFLLWSVVLLFGSLVVLVVFEYFVSMRNLPKRIRRWIWKEGKIEGRICRKKGKIIRKFSKPFYGVIYYMSEMERDWNI